MCVTLLILNHNGRHLLEAYLPSVVRAAATAGVSCSVGVVDNDSTDGSREWLAAEFPELFVWHCPNRGLCSFNDVLAEIDTPLSILLNNDIELETDFVQRLIAPLSPSAPEYDPRCFMAAPLCWLADQDTCEGFKTAVHWRWGLVQATGRYPGHQRQMLSPGLTASAGAAMAVDRRRFLSLGGFDPLYLPGRIEDLDFCYRGYQAGYVARYVPGAVCYHAGMATFGAVYGRRGCDALALRNTLLFQWKNLRHPLHLLFQFGGLSARLLLDIVGAPLAATEDRAKHWRAVASACRRLRMLRCGPQPTKDFRQERAFFRRFHPRRLAETPRPGTVVASSPGGARAARARSGPNASTLVSVN